VVVAAGNEGADAWTTDPASCAGLIVVGAVGRDGTRASYSNYGSRVSIMAPGGDEAPGGGILSTIKNAAGKAGYDYKIGTSMATPHVAGVIALMRSLRPKLTPNQLEELLDTEADAVNCSGKVGCGVGLLDAGAIMRYLKATSSVPWNFRDQRQHWGGGLQWPDRSNRPERANERWHHRTVERLEHHAGI
jgi:serine protease